jgi:hypothetical protein
VLYFSAKAGTVRGARYQQSVFGMGLASGVILQEFERTEGVASAFDATGCGRYLHYVGPEGNLQALDTATGTLRMRSALPMEPQTRSGVRVLLEAPGGGDRWIFSGESSTAAGSGFSAWVADNGQLAAEYPGLLVEMLVRLDSGTAVGLGFGTSREAMLGTQNNAGIWVFSDIVTTRPMLAPASAGRRLSGGFGTPSCTGNLCFDGAGTRYDFSAGSAATAERVIGSIGAAEGPQQPAVVGVHADVSSDELWYAVWRGITVVTLHRFRLSTARAATPLRFEGAPVLTIPVDTRYAVPFQRVGPDAMVLESLLIRDPRLATARQ